MRIRSAFLCGLAAITPLGMSAQHTKPTTAGSVAGIAPAIAPAPAAPHEWITRHGRVSSNTPILVLADGLVFANLGTGYEQGIRPSGEQINEGSQVLRTSPPL